MNRIFVSVPTKLLLLVVGALLLLSAGFSALSLSRLNAEIETHKVENLRQGQAQFSIHSTILKDQLRIWLESFGDVVHVKDKEDFNDLKDALSMQYEALQLNHNVENVWLVEENGNVLFSSDSIPAYVEKNISLLFQQQSPQSQLYCEQVCEQLIIVPLLNKKGNIAAVAMTVSLVDLISSINHALKSDIAIISYPKDEQSLFSEAQFISVSHGIDIKAMFSSSKTSDIVGDVLEQGIQLDLMGKHYLVTLMPLFSNEEQQFFMALVADVTSFTNESSRYRSKFLVSSLFIFIVLAVTVYIVSSPFTKRLMVLSNVLPLLAKKEFDKFRKVKIKSEHVFSDELDVLADASIELSYELEQLNIEVEQKTKELENIAMYDLLTGLPNRNMLNYQLRKAILSLSQYNTSVAVLFLDLDDFKKVNDSHGHTEGDQLLIEAANRVKSSIRKVDIACRFGGDEFVVILGRIDGIEDAKEIAENILESFTRPIHLGSSLFYVSTSIGIAYSEDRHVKADSLISHADIAMYEAKDEGGAQYFVYHDEMFERVAQRVLLEGEVRQALAKKQFSLSLQPQIESKTKKLYGFEALLRWQHPERGMVSPEDFIPILENSEHMIELGYWVIRRCFEVVTDLHRMGLTDVRMAINLSAGQFMDEHLPTYLGGLLKEFNLTADSFELELTEQTLVRDIDRAIDMMDKLKKVGFSFAIDDFGTGYSSLAYIKKMPVDVIKIDKSFIFGMLENHADYQIIMSTIAMVKNLGLQVIAEGVESSAQLRSLRENDCDLIQGYYFSKPIPEVEIKEFIDNKIVDGYWKTQAQV